MSLTNGLHDLLEDTGVGELNLVILGFAAILVVCGLLLKPLAMSKRVVLTTLAATVIGTAFVVEDQILGYEKAWGHMRDPLIRITVDSSDYMALLPISTVIGAAFVALSCVIACVLVVRLTKKGFRAPIVTGAAIVVTAALGITARAVYFHQPLNTEVEAVMYYAWLYIRDLSVVLIVPFAAACLMNVYRQGRHTSTDTEEVAEGRAVHVDLPGGGAKWQKAEA